MQMYTKKWKLEKIIEQLFIKWILFIEIFVTVLSHIPNTYKDINIAGHLGCGTAQRIHIHIHEEQGEVFCMVK